MKVLIIHNMLWAHYKSALFEAMEKARPEDMEITVLQISKSELSRKNMAGNSSFNYNYHLLYDLYLEEVPKFNSVIKTLLFIRKYNPDIVNVTGYFSHFTMPFAILFTKLLGKKLVISNESTLESNTTNPVKGYIKKFLLSKADGFITFGTSSAKMLENILGKPVNLIESKGAVVSDVEIRKQYTLAQQENFTIPGLTTKKNFIYVGRFIPEKNIPVLINAFQTLKRNLPETEEWGLLLLGNGSEEENIKTLISLQPKDIVHCNGVSWDKVPAYFSLADCIVLPSVYEPWGLVVNEAMICGLSAIVSDQCGCKDDLIKENGFIFSTQEELLKHMETIILEPDKLSRFKQRSLEIIKDFNLDAVSERIVNNFQKL
jgi:glycosyltransferase involved in cell wall biosynthesis